MQRFIQKSETTICKQNSYLGNNHLIASNLKIAVKWASLYPKCESFRKTASKSQALII